MSRAKKIPVKLTSLLSFIFFFSGFAALMYQVAWQRLLTVYYGVGSVSITLIVSVYMLGLGLGALSGGFLTERSKNKIILYFIVELLIGCFGLISLPFLDFLGRYTAGSSYLLSFFYMFLFLSIPTFLMGITLPLLTKIFNNITSNFLETVSFLYFINTIGAAVGAVFASYVIISFWGLDNAVFCAVAINFILALLILYARFFPVIQEKTLTFVRQEDNEAILGRVAYLLVVVTGFMAIGYEIVWFRVVEILVKSSPYAFSSVLFVYLSGIALGSFGMNSFLKKNKYLDKKSLFFFLQFLIGFIVIAIITGYYYLTKFTPLGIFTRTSFSNIIHPQLIFPSTISLGSFLRDVYLLFDVFLWPFLFVFIPTIIMGASFPLISSLALSQKDKEGKTIGTVYFFNITGNVLGGIFTGFLFLPYFGTEITLLVFSLIGVLFIFFVKRFAGIELHVNKRIAVVLALLIVSVLFFPKKGQLYEIMHISPEKFEKYLEEGRDGVIMTYKHNDEILNFINGLSHGGRPDYQNFHWVLEAVSYAPKAENILIIGYGTGSVTEAVLKIESVKAVTVVELNGELMTNLKKMSFFKEMLADKRINLIIDDGRRFLLRSDEKFDMVFMDPIRPMTAYSNNIYSLEFFNLVKQHLREDSIFMLYTHNNEVIIKTLISSMNHIKAYTRFMLTSKMPLLFHKEQREHFLEKLSTVEREAVSEKVSKETMYDNKDKDLEYFKKTLARYPVNHDWKPVAEYYIGSKFRKYNQPAIK
jgi:predicted membrane-bound spermidine synthase